MDTLQDLGTMFSAINTTYKQLQQAEEKFKKTKLTSNQKVISGTINNNNNNITTNTNKEDLTEYKLNRTAVGKRKILKSAVSPNHVPKLKNPAPAPYFISQRNFREPISLSSSSCSGEVINGKVINNISRKHLDTDRTRRDVMDHVIHNDVNPKDKLMDKLSDIHRLIEHQKREAGFGHSITKEHQALDDQPKHTIHQPTEKVVVLEAAREDPPKRHLVLVQGPTQFPGFSPLLSSWRKHKAPLAGGNEVHVPKVRKVSDPLPPQPKNGVIATTDWKEGYQKIYKLIPSELRRTASETNIHKDKNILQISEKPKRIRSFWVSSPDLTIKKRKPKSKQELPVTDVYRRTKENRVDILNYMHRRNFERKQAQQLKEEVKVRQEEDRKQRLYNLEQFRRKHRPSVPVPQSRTSIVHAQPKPNSKVQMSPKENGTENRLGINDIIIKQTNGVSHLYAFKTTPPRPVKYSETSSGSNNETLTHSKDASSSSSNGFQNHNISDSHQQPEASSKDSDPPEKDSESLDISKQSVSSNHSDYADRIKLLLQEEISRKPTIEEHALQDLPDFHDPYSFTNVLKRQKFKSKHTRLAMKASDFETISEKSRSSETSLVQENGREWNKTQSSVENEKDVDQPDYQFSFESDQSSSEHASDASELLQQLGSDVSLHGNNGVDKNMKSDETVSEHLSENSVSEKSVKSMPEDFNFPKNSNVDQELNSHEKRAKDSISSDVLSFHSATGSSQTSFKELSKETVHTQTSIEESYQELKSASNSIRSASSKVSIHSEILATSNGDGEHDTPASLVEEMINSNISAGSDIPTSKASDRIHSENSEKTNIDSEYDLPISADGRNTQTSIPSILDSVLSEYSGKSNINSKQDISPDEANTYKSLRSSKTLSDLSVPSSSIDKKVHDFSEEDFLETLPHQTPEDDRSIKEARSHEIPGFGNGSLLGRELSNSLHYLENLHRLEGLQAHWNSLARRGGSTIFRQDQESHEYLLNAVSNLSRLDQSCMDQFLVYHEALARRHQEAISRAVAQAVGDIAAALSLPPPPPTFTHQFSQTRSWKPASKPMKDVIDLKNQKSQTSSSSAEHHQQNTPGSYISSFESDSHATPQSSSSLKEELPISSSESFTNSSIKESVHLSRSSAKTVTSIESVQIVEEHGSGTSDNLGSSVAEDLQLNLSKNSKEYSNSIKTDISRSLSAGKLDSIKTGGSETPEEIDNENISNGSLRSSEDTVVEEMLQEPSEYEESPLSVDTNKQQTASPTSHTTSVSEDLHSTVNRYQRRPARNVNNSTSIVTSASSSQAVTPVTSRSTKRTPLKSLSNSHSTQRSQVSNLKDDLVTSSEVSSSSDVEGRVVALKYQLRRLKAETARLTRETHRQELRNKEVALQKQVQKYNRCIENLKKQLMSAQKQQVELGISLSTSASSSIEQTKPKIRHSKMATAEEKEAKNSMRSKKSLENKVRSRLSKKPANVSASEVNNVTSQSEEQITQYPTSFEKDSSVPVEISHSLGRVESHKRDSSVVDYSSFKSSSSLIQMEIHTQSASQSETESVSEVSSYKMIVASSKVSETSVPTEEDSQCKEPSFSLSDKEDYDYESEKFQSTKSSETKSRCSISAREDSDAYLSAKLSDNDDNTSLSDKSHSENVEEEPMMSNKTVSHNLESSLNSQVSEVLSGKEGSDANRSEKEVLSIDAPVESQKSSSVRESLSNEPSQLEVATSEHLETGLVEDTDKENTIGQRVVSPLAESTGNHSSIPEREKIQNESAGNEKSDMSASEPVKEKKELGSSVSSNLVETEIHTSNESYEEEFQEETETRSDEHGNSDAGDLSKENLEEEVVSGAPSIASETSDALDKEEDVHLSHKVNDSLVIEQKFGSAPSIASETSDALGKDDVHLSHKVHDSVVTEQKSGSAPSIASETSDALDKDEDVHLSHKDRDSVVIEQKSVSAPSIASETSDALETDDVHLSHNVHDSLVIEQKSGRAPDIASETSDALEKDGVHLSLKDHDSVVIEQKSGSAPSIASETSDALKKDDVHLSHNAHDSLAIEQKSELNVNISKESSDKTLNDRKNNISPRLNSNEPNLPEHEVAEIGKDMLRDLSVGDKEDLKVTVPAQGIVEHSESLSDVESIKSEIASVSSQKSENHSSSVSDTTFTRDPLDRIPDKNTLGLQVVGHIIDSEINFCLSVLKSKKQNNLDKVSSQVVTATTESESKQRQAEVVSESIVSYLVLDTVRSVENVFSHNGGSRSKVSVVSQRVNNILSCLQKDQQASVPSLKHRPQDLMVLSTGLEDMDWGAGDQQLLDQQLEPEWFEDDLGLPSTSAGQLALMDQAATIASYYFRAIPDKPPPPYTPPQGPMLERLVKMGHIPPPWNLPQDRKRVEGILELAAKHLYPVFSENIHNLLTAEPSSEYLEPTTKIDQTTVENEQSYKRFLFDLTKEVVHHHHSAKKSLPPWKRHHKLHTPQPTVPSNIPEFCKQVQQLTGAVLDENAKLDQALSSYLRYQAKRHDVVDRILLLEMAKEEDTWVDYQEDEASVKCVLADSVFSHLVGDTVDALEPLIYRRTRLQT